MRLGRSLGVGSVLLLAVACASAGSGGGGYGDGGLGGFGASGTGATGTGATGGFGATGTGATAGTGATGGFGATGGTGASGGTGATGGFGGSGATGGFGGTGGTSGGPSCNEATDCSSPTTMVCDPATGTCVTGQCSDTLTCATGKTCVSQVDNASVGACYPECIFGGAACAGGATCSVSLNGVDGFCWGAGSAAAGQTCQSTALNTGCAQGLLCAIDNGANVCRKQCSYWSSSPGCPSGQTCAIGGVCFQEAGDPAAIDGACASGVTGGEPCGSDGLAWRGVCADPGSGFVCMKSCRVSVSSDCPSGKTCQANAGEDVGLCG
jgi:hypothetical protein